MEASNLGGPLDSGRGAAHEQPKKLTNLDISLEWVPKVRVRTQVVTVPASLSFVPEVTGCLEFCDYSLGSPLRDADGTGDVTEPNPRFLHDRDENASVIREKSPSPRLFASHTVRLHTRCFRVSVA